MSNKRKTSELDLMAQETCIEILSRLPIRSMIESKVVCTEWRDLIESPEFTRFVPLIHMVEFPRISINHSRTPSNRPYKIHQIRDSNTSIVRMGLPDSVPVVRSSVDGLILLLHRLNSKQQQQQLWVCNPITREYLTIPNPPHYVYYDFGIGIGVPRYGGADADMYPDTDYGNYNFGFGVSRRSNRYKVVWISGPSQWHVFTLGGKEWRTLLSGPTLSRYHRWNTECAFLAGNLYWLDPDDSRIWCFDLETEVFTDFPAPPAPAAAQSYTRSLCVLKECLCLCDVWSLNGLLNAEIDAEIQVWLMEREFGDWSKEYLIRGVYRKTFFLPKVFPVRVLGDGSLLLGERGKPFLYHCINGVMRLLYPNTFLFAEPRNWYPRTAVFSPNFLPLRTLLKDMEEEEVQSL